MCGIGGVLDYLGSRASSESSAAIAASFLQCMNSRGPDDQGIWECKGDGILLTHNRLSIIEVGSKGRQPMMSRSKNLVISYNGELYNFRELRKELSNAGVSFQTQSDTEVLLEAIDAWGLDVALARFNGMFSFGLWNCSKKQLFLVRDQFGIKPLYAGVIDGKLVFASDLRAIKKTFPCLSLDNFALQAYLRYGFVPAPNSIYSGIYKIPPGTAICYSLSSEPDPKYFTAAQRPFQCTQFNSTSMYQFWSYARELEIGQRTKMAINAHDIANELNIKLREAVVRQSIAEVPLGAFLSGGIDSSLIVAILQGVNKTPVRTYTIGFENSQHDESAFAKQVANHLRTDHTELRVSESEAIEVAKRIGGIYDEPFADSSQIPTLMVSEMAVRDVKVVLTGDGGDEIFGGYNRHVHGVSLWQRFNSLPPSAQEALSKLALSNFWQSGIAESVLSRVVPALSHRSLENAAGKIAKIAASRSIRELYSNLISITPNPEEYLLSAIGSYHLPLDVGSALDEIRQFMLFDSISYLPDDILKKVDRATMSCSLEARVPFLDLEIVRFAAKIPTKYLVKGSSGKDIVKEVLRRYLPSELVDRPKMGFAVPLAEWLRGPLKNWSRDSINKSESMLSSLIDLKKVREEMDLFYSGGEDTSAQVWSFVMLSEWLQAQ